LVVQDPDHQWATMDCHCRDINQRVVSVFERGIFGGLGSNVSMLAVRAEKSQLNWEQPEVTVLAKTWIAVLILILKGKCLMVQAAVLLCQTVWGPRWFVPKRFLPAKYDYHRPVVPREVAEGALDSSSGPADVETGDAGTCSTKETMSWCVEQSLVCLSHKPARSLHPHLKHRVMQ